MEVKDGWSLSLKATKQSNKLRVGLLLSKATRRLSRTDNSRLCSMEGPMYKRSGVQ